MKKPIQILFILSFILITSCDESDQIGIGESASGSIATFHIVDDYLYIIDEYRLSIFDIKDYNDIEKVNSMHLGGRLPEALFSFENTLFIGTTNGVLFYDITNRPKPERLSVYNHLTSCDPVVSDGTFAYSTLRSGGNCGDNENLLDIIDIKNLDNPKLHKSIAMKTPYGLGLYNGYLFVGEKENGMKVFDIKDPENIELIGSYKDIKAIDFVPNGDVLVINTTNGVMQVSVSNDGSFSTISEIKYNFK